MKNDNIYLNVSWEKEPHLVNLVNSAIGCATENTAEALLVLIAFAGQVNTEELFSIYNRLPGYFPKKIIPQLMKKGYIEKIKLKKPLGACKSCYVLSKRGVKVAAELVGDDQSSLKRINKAEIEAHSYAVGYNFYQFVRMGLPFQWTKEAPYSDPLKENKYSYKPDNKFVYRSDCTVFLKEKERLVYIEEDLLNESYSILEDKIKNYVYEGCLKKT